MPEDRIAVYLHLELRVRHSYPGWCRLAHQPISPGRQQPVALAGKE